MSDKKTYLSEDQRFFLNIVNLFEAGKRKMSLDYQKKTGEAAVIDINFTDHDEFGELSDGYHTFNELYEYRMLYNAALFYQLYKDDQYDGMPLHRPHKSYCHSDGELCFGGGWFIVVAYLNGKQISNHYENKHWDLFNIPEQPQADLYDGHTPEDVAIRLKDYLNDKKQS